MADWSREFDDPIPLRRGRQLLTFKDAADYILKPPKAEQNLEEWQTAIGCLIGAAEGRDFVMHPELTAQALGLISFAGKPKAGSALRIPI
jgi:hypothetical protein